MGGSNRVSCENLLSFYNEIMQKAYDYGSSTIQGLKEKGISAYYSLDTNSLMVDYNYPHCRELSESAYRLIGTYDTDSSLYVSGKFFRLLPSIVGKNIMFYFDAYEEYDSYDTDIHISINGT